MTMPLSAEERSACIRTILIVLFVTAAWTLTFVPHYLNGPPNLAMSPFKAGVYALTLEFGAAFAGLRIAKSWKLATYTSAIAAVFLLLQACLVTV